MKLVTDTHSHTVASGHAYSTVEEYARHAKEKGLEMIAITDHGMDMPGGPHPFHFWNMKVIPDIIEGVRILKGVEANILDCTGRIDMPDELLERLDIVIISMHDVCIKPGTVEENTTAYIEAMKNPYVDIIGHSGNPMFPVDVEKYVSTAKKYNKIIEINNTSLKGGIREGSRENCALIVKECCKQGVYMCTSTDSHIAFDIGELSLSEAFIKEVGVDENLILSTSKEKFLEVLRQHGKRV